MTQTDPTAVDPADPEFVADPYPVFQALRERDGIHFHPDWGVRVAVSHEACSRILKHRGLGRIWADAEPVADFESFNALHRLNMLENEQDHDRLRSAVAGLFHRKHIRSLRHMIAGIVEHCFSELRDGIDEHGSADLMRDVARPLPLDVIATLLAFPRQDRKLFQAWSNRIVTMYEPGVSEAVRHDAEHAAQEFRDYVGDLIAFRRRHPGDDLLSTLTDALDSDNPALNREELIANYVLLLMAGHEASVNGIGNAVVALHEHPAQWRFLREQLLTDETGMNTAVDELLRFDTPNQLFERTATRTVDLAGHRVEQGETVTVLLGAANRDPAVFTTPDDLDLTRSPNPHLALGAGVHYCLGAPLARLEIATALAALANRMPDYRLTAPPRRRSAFAIRGFECLDITT